MVARINTIAFHGVAVQTVDVQVQTGNRLPAITAAGCVILLWLIVTICTWPTSANAKGNCLMYGAEYIPQKSTYELNEAVLNKSLSFVLRIEKGDIGSSIRSTFLNFDAYDKSGKKVSTMRFGDSWSNGVARQGFSTYFGMYCTFGKDSESDCRDMKSSAAFYPIGVNADLSSANINSAPDLLIFPGTYWQLRYGSFQVPEHWDQYIRFYTEDRIYPDFRGYDFWVRKKCGDTAEVE